MPETLVAPQTAIQPEPKVPVQAEAPKEDLITRASKVTLDKPKEADKPAEESIKLDQATIDKIADPALKAAVLEAYKSMQADYTRKTQEVAQKRKEAESLATKPITVDDIARFVNDPNFIQSAQEYQRINGGQSVTQYSNGNGELTQEEFSYLSPEQQKLYLKTQQVEKSNQAILAKLHSTEVSQEDITLKSKYANYDALSVNEIYNGMMSGKIQATREHLWKVADYDNAVKRAYQLGLEDRKMEMGEKVNASSQTNGVTVTATGDVPARLQNESGIEYFKRIALHNASKLMKK